MAFSGSSETVALTLRTGVAIAKEGHAVRDCLEAKPCQRCGQRANRHKEFVRSVEWLDVNHS